MPRVNNDPLPPMRWMETTPGESYLLRLVGLPLDRVLFDLRGMQAVGNSHPDAAVAVSPHDRNWTSGYVRTRMQRDYFDGRLLRSDHWFSVRSEGRSFEDALTTGRRQVEQWFTRTFSLRLIGSHPSATAEERERQMQNLVTSPRDRRIFRAGDAGLRIVLPRYEERQVQCEGKAEGWWTVERVLVNESEVQGVPAAV